MKSNKHGHRMPKGKGKSMRGTRHVAYDSIYGDQGKKHPAHKDGERDHRTKNAHAKAREKRLSKERM